MNMDYNSYMEDWINKDSNELILFKKHSEMGNL